MTMRRTLLHLACAVALGGFALAAQAQQYGTPGATSRPSESTVTPTTKAKPNPNAARDAEAVERCSQFTGAVRVDCLAREKANTDHAVNEMAAGTAAGAGAAKFGSSGGPAPSNKVH
jgi:hypothetical protein